MSEWNLRFGRSAFPHLARMIARAGATLVVVVGLAAVVIGRTAPGSSIGSDQGRAAPAAASPSSVAAASQSAAATPTPSPGAAAACAVTRPEPVFKAPKPFPVRPPAYYRSDWYGSGHLWTMLDHDGETWQHLPTSPSGLTQKTFWWSQDWIAADEPEPAISVTGHRLDGPGGFSFGPGTNATADFGTAMLVGIEIPTAGCWEITARYRTATLSYVVSVRP